VRAALRKRLTLAGLALALMVAIAATLAATSGGDPTLSVDISSRALGGPIPPGFLGLSIEYTSLEGYLGNDPHRPDPLFVALVRNLDPGQSPVLRIGGDSTDWTWWPVAGMRRPGGIRLTLTRRLLAVLAATARELNARMIMGINLEANSRRIAGAEARALAGALGHHLAYLELGNEPELYGAFAWYVAPDGTRVYGRPHRGWDFASYLADYGRILAALPKDIPIAGMATGSAKWWSQTARFLRRYPHTALLTYHRYPLRGCNVAPNSPQTATIPHLLADSASIGLAASIANALAAARSRGVPVRVDELNSVACGGTHGVSDSFASALWMTEALFAMAAEGVQGVNVHTGVGLRYAPFVLTESHGSWSAHVEPDYYGMEFFARAAPPGSRLLALRASDWPHLQAWATRSADGTIRAVLLDTSAHQAAEVNLSTPLRADQATVQQLRGPSLAATGGAGVTLAGQHFARESRTGRMVGRLQEPVLHGSGGRFQVTLAPASAVLVTIR
jgi:hypothetical protein